MHAALRLDEVVEQVVVYLPSRDVLSVARVCRDWYAIAIALYWDSKIVTVDRLLSLLPLSQHKPLTFRTSINADSFKLMLAVVPRIRNLLLRFWPPVDHRVFDTLSDRVSHAFKAPVSAGLRRLDWRISAQSHVRMFVALLGPSIRTINVSFPNTEATFDLTKMFNAVGSRSPYTESLNVSILYPSHTFMEAFVACVRTLDLRQAVLQFNISPAALRVLALLPNLECLDCECHSDLGLWQPLSTAPLFPALRRLRINGYHAAFMSILDYMTSPFQLESLQLNIGDGLEHTLSQTISLLGDAAPHLHTLVLRTHTTALKTAHKPDAALVRTVPYGLLQCTRLEHVHLVYPYAMQWDDADFARLALALPRLRVFRMNAYPARPPTKPRATLDAMRAFAAHCPSLLELELFVLVNTAGAATLDAVDPHVCLRYLDVGKSPVAPETLAQDVARILVRAFPRLDELRSAETDSSEAGCLWETVESARARSARWDAVRAAYTAARGKREPERRPDLSESPPRVRLSHVPVDMVPARASSSSSSDSTPFDTVPAWPFA